MFSQTLGEDNFFKNLEIQDPPPPTPNISVMLYFLRKLLGDEFHQNRGGGQERERHGTHRRQGIWHGLREILGSRQLKMEHGNRLQ